MTANTRNNSTASYVSKICKTYPSLKKAIKSSPMAQKDAALSQSASMTSFTSHVYKNGSERAIDARCVIVRSEWRIYTDKGMVLGV